MQLNTEKGIRWVRHEEAKEVAQKYKKVKGQGQGVKDQGCPSRAQRERKCANMKPLDRFSTATLMNNMNQTSRTKRACSL